MGTYKDNLEDKVFELQSVLNDTIKMVDTKQDIINKLQKKVVDLSDGAEFWECLADKRKKQLDLALDFIQYILDQWEIDTAEAQETAEDFLGKIYNVKIKCKNKNK